MRRRALIAGMTGALWWGGYAATAAQSIAKPRRITILRGPSADYLSERFKKRLAELGYVEGRDYILEIAAHHGHLERLPELAAALLQRQPAVIVAAGPEAVLKAVSSTTKTIPIIFLAIDYDPVTLGYVVGLPRPGGNLTGIFAQQVELSAKRIELLEEALPADTAVAVFADDFTPDSSGQMRAAGSVASRLGLTLLPIMLSNVPHYDFAKAVGDARAAGAQAVMALMSPGFFYERKPFVEALLEQKMPASFGVREFADLGGLMSYGANLTNMYERAADYVDKILKGGNPGELPVEQPTKFELVLNLKTAKALGLTVPQSIIARADDVIE